MRTLEFEGAFDFPLDQAILIDGEDTAVIDFLDAALWVELLDRDPVDEDREFRPGNHR